MELDERRLGHLNLVEFWRECARWGVGGRVEETDGVVLYATGSFVPVDLNGAFRTGPDIDPAEVLDQAEWFFGPLERGYCVRVRDDEDGDLRRACEQRGLVRFGQPSPQMVCRDPVGPVRPTPAEIRQVATASDVADFAAVNADAYATYGMPGEEVRALFGRPQRLLDARHVVALVAREQDRPVAAALALLSHQIAGVYWVGTVQSARGRGLGAAVASATTNAALERCAQVVTLQASVMGEPIYRAMGYQVLYHYENWVRWPKNLGPLPPEASGAPPGASAPGRGG